MQRKLKRNFAVCLVGRGKRVPPISCTRSAVLSYVDAGGVSDHVFALFHLLGLILVLRLRDFPDRRLACFGMPGC